MIKYLIALLLIPSIAFSARWECLTDSAFCGVYRMNIPHGWLVKYTEGGLIFIHDEKHDWKLDD